MKLIHSQEIYECFIRTTYDLKNLREMIGNVPETLILALIVSTKIKTLIRFCSGGTVCRQLFSNQVKKIYITKC